jgi:hypothetical protein
MIYDYSRCGYTIVPVDYCGIEMFRLDSSVVCFRPLLSISPTTSSMRDTQAAPLD